MEAIKLLSDSISDFNLDYYILEIEKIRKKLEKFQKDIK